MNFLVLIPTAAFVLLHWVKLPSAPGALWRAVAVWGVLFAGVALVFWRLPERWFYPRNEALQLVQRQAKRLHARPIKPGEVVLLIDGSSATAKAVRCVDLERLLRERNLPARVFQISPPGSNHFERLVMLREWLRGLSPQEAAALAKSRVVLLSEVLYVYDFSPLQGFAENAFSDRSVAYATPENLGPMLASIWERRDVIDPGLRWTLPPLVIGHGLFNLFRVGTLHCVELPRAGYSANGPPAGAAAVPPASAALAPAGAQPPPRAFSEIVDFDYAARLADYRRDKGGPAPAEFDHLPFRWAHTYTDALGSLTAGYVDEVGYFSVPSLDAVGWLYQEKFLGSHRDAVLRLDGSQSLALLDGARYWQDVVHVREAGTEVFTKWLADRLAEAWPQIAGTAPKEQKELARKPSQPAQDAL